MKSCPDGYPSCRHAEASGQWCKDGCAADIQRELNQELAKRAALNEKFIARTNTEGRTRARTTTHTANAARITDRIVWLRSELKKIAD